MPASVTLTQPTGTLRPLLERTVRETAHLLLDLPVGIAGFTVMVAALSTGASLAITLAGVPLLAAALVLARSAAGAERTRARALLAVVVSAPPARPRAASVLGRLVDPLRDAAAWRAAAYFVALLPAGAVTSSAACAWWGGGLYLLTLPAWVWALPDDGLQIPGGPLWSSPAELAASTAAGGAVLAAAPFVVHALAGIDRALVRLLGTP